MATGPTCSRYAQVNGKDSTMYKELLEKGISRPMVNYIYADFIASNTASVMKSQGYAENSQGQFSADSLLKYLNYHEKIEKDLINILKESVKYGIADNMGTPIDYADAKTALDQAKVFNDKHNALVATVDQHGDAFNIIVSEKDSRTHLRPVAVAKKIKVWDMLKTEFAQKLNVDIDNMPKEAKSIFNANNLEVIRNLSNLKISDPKYMFPRDALLLFSLYPNSTKVTRLVGNNAFGSLQDAANALEGLRNGQPYTATQRTYLFEALDYCKQFNNIDLQSLQAQVDNIIGDKNSPEFKAEYDIANELHKLKKQYNIEINELQLIGDRIDTLSQAVGYAILQLNRKIDSIKKLSKSSPEGKRLEGVLNSLEKELRTKQYYNGMVQFLNEAQNGQKEVERLLNTTPSGNTELERLFNQAKIFMSIKEIRDQFFIVVDALADESLKIDESINKTDIDKMRTIARDLRDYFIKITKAENRMHEEYMQNLLREYLGDETPNGLVIPNLVVMAQKDMGIMNYLYSVGNASNPMVAVMGTIIREAQESRNVILTGFSRRIRKETNKLYKSGSNSKFMYEPDDIHILSDIDWDKYNEDYKKQRDILKRQNLKGFDLQIALDAWEDANTEDRVVDKISKRTERVPNSKYRKNNGLVWNSTTNEMDFVNSGLTKEQQKYYNAMMQIKGEVGTLLPDFVRQHYLAPQMRREFLDALQDAKSAWDVLKAIKTRIEDMYKIREDDPDYYNGIIGGEEFSKAKGRFDNTELREIPIFYVGKVEEGQLLKNFSTGLQHLASTAANYTTMSDIQDVVEFMSYYIKSKPTRADLNKADIVTFEDVAVMKVLYNYSQNTNTSNMLDGWVGQHLFGIKKSPKEDKRLRLATDKLIGYTSLKALSTNVKGMISNFLVGEYQMLMEAGVNEFYNYSDFLFAHTRLLFGAGMLGEMMEIATNNVNHKATLMQELFDPIGENYRNQSHKKYYKSWLRILFSHDLTFLGYASGEFLIHFINMYAVLHHNKVFRNGKKRSLYSVFKVGKKEDGNSELVILDGVTKGEKVNGKWVDTGEPIDFEYINNIKRLIREVNEECHGALNEEDKGIIHQRLLGALAANFRQWMIEHYSRRFRNEHFNYLTRKTRGGSWNTVLKEGFKKGKGMENWKEKHYTKALGNFIREVVMFTLRAQSQWPNLNEEQKLRVKRAHSELTLFLLLAGFNMGLGEPDEYKRRFWMRMLLYQMKRLQMEAEASLPVHPKMLKSMLTLLQSPIAAVSVMNSFLYLFFGLDDLITLKKIKTGRHAGELKYFYTIKKNLLPFYKDWEQLQNMDTDDAVFQIFDDTSIR